MLSRSDLFLGTPEKYKTEPVPDHFYKRLQRNFTTDMVGYEDGTFGVYNFKENKPVINIPMSDSWRFLDVTPNICPAKYGRPGLLSFMARDGRFIITRYTSKRGFVRAPNSEERHFWTFRIEFETLLNKENFIIADDIDSIHMCLENWI